LAELAQALLHLGAQPQGPRHTHISEIVEHLVGTKTCQKPCSSHPTACIEDTLLQPVDVVVEQEFRCDDCERQSEGRLQQQENWGVASAMEQGV